MLQKIKEVEEDYEEGHRVNKVFLLLENNSGVSQNIDTLEANEEQKKCAS
jgi:hypothetical protein